MDKKVMTERDYELYMFLVNYIKKNGYPPSYREIAVGIGLKSASVVIEKLWRLQNLGKIEMKPKTPRAIKIIGYTFVKEK